MRKLKSLDVIRHPRFQDVCCLVDQYFPDSEIGVLVSWINTGFKNSWYIGTDSEWIQIDSDWEICEEPSKNCLRYAKWRKLG
jgi:hypothetical protein